MKPYVMDSSICVYYEFAYFPWIYLVGYLDYLAEVPRAIVYEKLSAVLTTDPT